MHHVCKLSLGAVSVLACSYSYSRLFLSSLLLGTGRIMISEVVNREPVVPIAARREFHGAKTMV